MMQIDLTGQNVVITGGAVRVGRAIALACAQSGAGVAITYRNSRESAEQTVRELQTVGGQGQAFAALPLDAADDAAIAALPAQVEDAIGPATALVNNAAMFRRTPFADLAVADFDQHLQVNLRCPFLLCKAFGDAMLLQGKGAIVNIADINGLRPLKDYLPYCISKAGLITLTEGLAKALAPQVRVNCICPGTILPPSEDQGEPFALESHEARIPLRRIGTPEAVAQTVLFLLGGPDYLTGTVIPVDGGQRLRGER